MTIGLSALTSAGCSNVNLTPRVVAPLTLSLEIQNYCPATGAAGNPNTYVDHFIYNSSAYFNVDQSSGATGWLNDMDRDGLPDFQEQSTANFSVFGTSYLSWDTSGNLYGDLTKVRVGLNAAEQSIMPICQTGTLDTDHDGLTDCEENLIGTNPLLADTVNDGIPDGLKIRFGANPLDPHESQTSMTGDNVSNVNKIKMGVTVNTFLSADNQTLTPVYTSAPSTSSTKTNCMTFGVSNIPVVQVPNGNLIQAIVLEDQQQPAVKGIYPILRVARTLTILVPSTIGAGSTVLVSDGINGQYVDGVIIPLVVIGGGGS